MDIQAVNTAFNEALEEIGEDTPVFSMEFAQHHEAELEARITRLRNRNAAQNMGFLLLLAGLVLAFRRGMISLPVSGLGNSSLLALALLWLLIGGNSLVIGRRNRRVQSMEKQLLLISVYRKILQKDKST